MAVTTRSKLFASSLCALMLLAGCVVERADAFAPSDGTSDLTVAPSAVVADGISAGQILVTLKSPRKTPLPDIQVRLKTNCAGAQLTQPKATDASGRTQATISSRTPGTCIITGESLVGGTAFPLAAETRLTFTPSAQNSNEMNPEARIALNLTAEPNQQLADGNAAITVTVRAADSAGPAAVGRTVVLTTTGLDNALYPASGTLGPDGTMQATLASTRAEHKSITATLDGLQAHAEVAFFAGAADNQASGLTVTPAFCVANGACIFTAQLKVADALGNGVGQVPVHWSSSDSNDLLAEPDGVTDANGVLRATFTTHVVGDKILSALAGNFTLQAPYAGVAPSPNVVFSAIALESATVVADGTSVAAITVHVADDTGIVMANVPVSLQALGLAGNLQPSFGTTDSQGNFIATYKSAQAGNHLIVATLQNTISLTRDIAFVSGPPNYGTSQFFISPSKIAADNNQKADVTVVLKDSLGNPAAHAQVAFSASTPGIAFSPAQATSDAQGRITGQVTAAAAGNFVLSAAASSTTLTAPISCTVGPPNPGVSALRIAPSVVLADDTSTAQLELNVFDLYGNPIPDIAAQVLPSGTGLRFSRTTGVTDNAGKFNATVSAAQAQNTVIQIEVAGTSISARIRFLPGMPSPVYSSISAQPNTIIAGGGPSTVVVTARDESNNPVVNAAVTLRSTDSGLLFSSTQGTTDATGTFYTQVRATQGGSKTIDAVMGSVQLTQHITATAGVPSAAMSSLSLSPNRVVADGSSSATMVISVLDFLGNPVIGAPVTFSGVQAADTFAPAHAVTDAAGLATTVWTTTRAGATTLRAQAQDLVLQVSARATAGAAYAPTSACAAQPNSLTADNTTTSTISIFVKDAFGNPVAYEPITMASQGDVVTITPSSTTTSSAGIAQVAARSPVAQSTQLTASIGAIQIPCALTFTPGPAYGPYSVASAVPSLVSSDGATTATFRATFYDAQHNAIAGRTVLIAASGTGNTLSATQQTTDAQGRISASLASNTPENKTITATLDGVTLSARVTFVTGPAGALSTVDVTPQTITADTVQSGNITVTARDDNGHLLVGEPISLMLSGGPGALSASSGTTDASGQFTASVTSSVAGTRVVTASIGATDVTQNLTFVAGPVAFASSALSASPNRIVADGSSQSRILLYAADAFGNPIADLAASLTTDGTAVSINPANGNTTALGQWMSMLTSTTAQATTVSVNAGGQTFTAPVTWLAGPASTSTSTWTLSPNSALADGSDFIDATLVVRDGQNNPISGAAVTVTSSGSSTVIAPSMGSSNSAGRFTTVIRSQKAELKTLTAAFESKSLATQAMFRPGPPHGPSSALTLSPNVLTADGASSSTLIFTLKDAFGNAIGNQAFTGAASGTTGPFSGATDASGRYTAALNSTVAQQENITITVGAQTWSASIQFVPGPPSAANSNFSLAPATLVANGADQAAVTVVMRDAYNNAIPAALVALDDTTAQGDSYGALSGATDAAGIWRSTVASTYARSTTLRASLGSDAVPPALTAPITFLPGPADANASSLTLSPNSTVADGSASTLVQVRTRDAFGNPVPNVSIALSASSGNCTFNPNTGFSNAAGIFSATLTSVVAQPQTISATLGPIADGRTVAAAMTFVAGPPAAEQSELTASPNTLVADSTSTATVTAKLRDAQGNPTPNQTITLMSSGGNNTITPLSASGTPGVYVGAIASSRAQNKVLTASFNSKTIQTSVLFVAGPAATAQSTLTASPSANIWANDQQTARLVATLADAYGNPVAGQSLSFTSDAPDTFAPTSGTTASDGTLTTLVHGRTAGTHTIKATSGAAQPSVQVSFLPAAYPANSSLTASPNTLTANANTPITLTLTARDGNNAPLPGASVAWSGRVPGFSISPSVSSTNAFGVATTTMRSGTATQQMAYAAVTGSHFAAPVTLNPRSPSCTRLMSYSGLPWPEVFFADQTDAAVADLNHDGLVDLVVLSASSKFAVLLGNGNRTWQPPVNYASGRNSLAMALQDINGDTHADIIILARDEAGILVYLGRGDGTFNTATKYSTDSFPDNLIMMDVNNDGIADAIVMNASRQAVHVLLGQANGSFQTRVDYGLSFPPADVAVQSVISSSNDIILLNSATNQVIMLPNRGDGTFGAAVALTVGNSPKSVVAGDLTGDGLADIVVAHSGEKTFGVLKNLGGGNFSPIQKYTTIDNITALALAQLGGSSALDISAVSKWRMTNYLYENSGDGNFIFKSTLQSGSASTRVRVADVDGDGFPDFLLPGQTPRSQLQLQYTDGAYNGFAGRTYAGFGMAQVAMADFDNDGHTDVFVAGFGASHRLYLGSASGQLGSPTTVPNDGSNLATSLPLVRDFDGDGFMDVAIVNQVAKTLSVYLHGTPGPFKASVKYPISSNVRNLAAGDINDDGVIDLITVNSDDAQLGIFLGRADGTFVQAPAVAVGANPSDALLADFDGDGSLDLAVANKQAGTVGILFNDGRGGFTAMTSYAAPYGAQALAAADFDANGQVDVAVLGTAANPIALLLNSNGTFASGPLTNRIPTAKQLAVGDFNGDGRPDLVALPSNDPSLIIFLNTGSNAFEVGRAYATGASAPDQFAFADLNGDGILDFAVVHNDAMRLTTLIADGCP